MSEPVIVDPSYTSEEFIAEVVQNLEQKGFYKIENFFSDEIIQQAVSDVKKEMPKYDGEYFSLRRDDYVHDSVLKKIHSSTEFKEFLDKILAKSNCPSLPSPDKQNIHHVLRVCQGEKNVLGTEKYHFDAYFLTGLMPVIMPPMDQKDRGDLVVFPNTRKFSKNFVSNMAWKLLMQNKYTQKATGKYLRKLMNNDIHRFLPGDLFLFYGYRTYHGNLALEGGSVRATAIFHYGNPNIDNTILNKVEKNRKRPQQKEI